MALLKLHGMMAAGTAAVALTAGGTAAGMAIAAGPVDSAGVVHGCYAPQGNKGSYQLKLQNAGTDCPSGFTAITWNQQGPQGPAGATGATGPQGPAGPGLVFTMASGVNGPAVPTAGTYLINVVLGVINQSSSAMQFDCGVGVQSNFPGLPPEFTQIYELPGNSAGGAFSLSGVTALQAGAQLTVSCFTDAGLNMPIGSARWSVAPVQTAG